MSATDDRSRLQAYLDGELDEAARAEVDRELTESASLRDELDRLRAAADLARRSALPEPPADLVEAVSSRLANDRLPWWQRLLPGAGRPLPTLAWGTVTTVLLAVVMLPVTDLQTRDAYSTVSGSMSPDMPPPPSPPATAALPPGGPGAGVAPGGPGGPAPMAGGAVPAMPAPGGPMAKAGEPSRAAAGAEMADAAAPAGRAPKAAMRKEARAGAPTRATTAKKAPHPPQHDDEGGQRLSAGKVDDNAMLGRYVDYLGQHPAPQGVRQFSPRERYVLRVVDPQGRGVPDALIKVAATQAGAPVFTARTDSSGQAALFVSAVTEASIQQTQRLYATVTTGAQGAPSAPVTIDRKPEGGVVRLTADSQGSLVQPMPLDVAFVVDTTGSMTEEIGRIRDTIDEVAARIEQLSPKPKLRLGMVIYRDHGDAYVTKVFDFTSDVAAFQAQLANVRAEAGGDTPEDVCLALSDAVHKLKWSPTPALRLSFLIGDAPPHLDYQNEPNYLPTTQEAVAAGIKFFAVACSGQDDTGEYVWRQLALLTRGRFIFITKGGSAGLTPHHVERQDFTVQALPDLVVACVGEELARLGRNPDEEPVVTLPPPVEPKPHPVPPVVTPPVVHHPVSRPHRLPFWTTMFVLAANVVGWGYAFRRSRRPLRG